jgi:hypothetical protein
MFLGFRCVGVGGEGLSVLCYLCYLLRKILTSRLQSKY